MPNDLFARLPVSEPKGAESEIYAERLQRKSPRPDSGTRLLTLVAGGVGGALLLLIGAWNLGGHGSGAVPIVAAPSGPMRVRPDNRGGMQIAGMNDPILSGDFGQGEAALAPAPETPKPKALRTQIEAERAKSPARPALSQAKAEPVPAAAAEQAVRSERMTSSKSAAEPVREAPKAGRMPVPSAAAPASPGMDRAPALAGSVETGVQLAALKSEGAARTEWERMLKHMPELLAGRRPLFVRTVRGGHVFWRLRTGDFADHAKAAEFCVKVRAKGGDCVVSSF